MSILIYFLCFYSLSYFVYSFFAIIIPVLLSLSSVSYLVSLHPYFSILLVFLASHFLSLFYLTVFLLSLLFIPFLSLLFSFLILVLLFSPFAPFLSVTRAKVANNSSFHQQGKIYQLCSSNTLPCNSSQRKKKSKREIEREKRERVLYKVAFVQSSLMLSQNGKKKTFA